MCNTTVRNLNSSKAQLLDGDDVDNNNDDDIDFIIF